MAQDALPGILDETATRAVARLTIELEPEALELLDDSVSPREYLKRLIESGQELDAIRFLALALSNREAVAWGSACLRATLASPPPLEQVEALEVVDGWVREPDEDGARTAESLAESLGLESPCGLLAMAVFTSGKSIAPAGLPVVPPPPGLTGRAVAGALQAAAFDSEGALQPGRYREFLARGISIAMAQA